MKYIRDERGVRYTTLKKTITQRKITDKKEEEIY